MVTHVEVRKGREEVRFATVYGVKTKKGTLVFLLDSGRPATGLPGRIPKWISTKED